MDISKRLIDIRKEKGITQYRLARLSGIAQGSISNYELGKFTPGIDIVKALCETAGPFDRDCELEIYVYVQYTRH